MNTHVFTAASCAIGAYSTAVVGSCRSMRPGLALRLGIGSELRSQCGCPSYGRRERECAKDQYTHETDRKTPKSCGHSCPHLYFLANFVSLYRAMARVNYKARCSGRCHQPQGRRMTGASGNNGTKSHTTTATVPDGTEESDTVAVVVQVALPTVCLIQMPRGWPSWPWKTGREGE